MNFGFKTTRFKMRCLKTISQAYHFNTLQRVSLTQGLEARACPNSFIHGLHVQTLQIWTLGEHKGEAFLLRHPKVGRALRLHAYVVARGRSHQGERDDTSECAKCPSRSL